MIDHYISSIFCLYVSDHVNNAIISYFGNYPNTSIKHLIHYDEQTDSWLIYEITTNNNKMCKKGGNNFQV